MVASRKGARIFALNRSPLPKTNTGETNEAIAMKILEWWKEVPLGLAGFTFEIVPKQKICSDASCFDLIVEAVKKSDCNYILYEETATVISQR